MIMGVEILRVSLFLGCIALVYYLSLRWCVDTWRGKEARTAIERVFRSRKVGTALLLFAAIGLCCMAYGFFIEPTRLTVAHHEIRTSKLKPGERIRIVHLADLHIREEGVRERKLPNLVRSLEPDLILHTGDFFADRDMARVVTALLQSWDVPQYACKGNLDSIGDFESVMKASGVRVLGRSQSTFRKEGVSTPVVVSGFPSGAELFGMKPILQELTSDTFNIVLYHHPQGFPLTWDTQADLMLAGHTHGGQIRLPFYGALITLDACGKRWESGFYEEEGVRLIVSRGIGCEPNIPEVRFLCAPEVIVIDVLGQGGHGNGHPQTSRYGQS